MSLDLRLSGYIRQLTVLNARIMTSTLLSGSTFCRLHHASNKRPAPMKLAHQRSAKTTCQATTVEFTKYQGLGNDFILVSASDDCQHYIAFCAQTFEFLSKSE